MTHEQLAQQVQRLAHIVSQMIDGMASRPEDADPLSPLIEECRFCGRSDQLGITHLIHADDCPATLLQNLIADIEAPATAESSVDVTVWPEKEQE